MDEEIKQEINAQPGEEPQVRPEGWTYDMAEECIRKAIDAMKKNNIRKADFKVQFEPWLSAEFSVSMNV